MKKLFHFNAQQPAVKNLLPYIFLVMLQIAFAVKATAQDPQARMKQAALAEDTIKAAPERVVLDKQNPVLKTNVKRPIAYRTIPLTLPNGRVVQPNEKVTMADGSVITAAEYLNRVNNIERNLNAKGNTMQGSGKVIVGSIVTPAKDLDGQAKLVGRARSALLSDAAINEKMKKNITVGAVTLKPVEEYSAVEKDAMARTIISTKNGKAAVKILNVKPMPAPSARNSHLLQNFSKTISKDWHFGNRASFFGGINGSLTLNAKIYSYDPENPSPGLSEYQLLADAKTYASVLNHSFDIATAHFDLYAPADKSKKMKLKSQIKVVGITVFNLDEQYTQMKTFQGTKAKNISKSYSVEIPIGWGFDFTGRIGIDGTIGFDYAGELSFSFVSARCKPYADIKGKAEAGIDFLSVVGGGVGGRLTIVKGNLDLSGYIGIWAQNANQVVLVYSYYLGYNLELLKGELYCYVEACLFGYCWRALEFTFFRWNGFTQSGTFATDTKIVPIANL